MKKPWTLDEANALVTTLRPASVEFGFAAGLGPEALDPKDPLSLVLYFKPIPIEYQQPLMDRTAALLNWLRDLWGHPHERIKEEFNPFGRRGGDVEPIGPAPRPQYDHRGRRIGNIPAPAGRVVVERHVVQAVPAEEWPNALPQGYRAVAYGGGVGLQPEAPQPLGAAGYQGMNPVGEANQAELRQQWGGLGDNNQANGLGGDAPLAAAYFGADAEDVTRLVKTKPKPTYRFKYMFIRPDGGPVFVIVH